jgi:hypothetical protein
VATAAQIMLREDVGPVPVVDGNESKRLVGIVTDRDLAMKVVAEGRDAYGTRVDQVMTSNPVTCQEDWDVMQAVKTMADHQVRRIPIVDSNGRLTGIVAQADVARTADEEQVGEMVEEISQPYGLGEWPDDRYREREHASMPGASALAVGALCVGVGAALMYVFDPSRGHKRRMVLRDKAVKAAHSSTDTVRRTSQDLRNRASGVYSATRSKLRPSEVGDEKLIERVRSKMGREVSNPHAVQVTANQGNLTLAGAILADEVDALVRCVRQVPGVQSVENNLEVHDRSENHPSLQGRRKNEESDRSAWSTARILTSAVGGGLMLYGLKSGSKAGKATAGIGMGLLTRGLTNREFGRLGEFANLRALRGF